ncbi:hypothetical protein LINPERHAP1_LOCUS7917 [Linum perenne]
MLQTEAVQPDRKRAARLQPQFVLCFLVEDQEVKMGNICHLTRSKEEVRKNCRKMN